MGKEFRPIKPEDGLQREEVLGRVGQFLREYPEITCCLAGFFGGIIGAGLITKDPEQMALGGMFCGGLVGPPAGVLLGLLRDR